MAFIEPISKADAGEALAEHYAAAETNFGYIPNYLKLFSHRPEVFEAWMTLIASIRGNMSLRRYELVTLAAARKLQGTYCMLAHSEALLNAGEVDTAQLAAIAEDYHDAGLTPEEVIIMEFAEKIITQSCSVTQDDVDLLRGIGLLDAEILDITLAASVRSFFSKTLDALGAEPDAKFMNFDAELRRTLSVGRPFGFSSKE